MPTGSGISSQTGAKKETTYGTRAVPDTFFEFETEGFQLEKQYLESRQVRAGRFFQSGSRRVATTRGVVGSLAGEVPNIGFGLFLDLLHGNTVTPVQQTTTTAYLQTHNIGTSDPGKSITLQVGKTETGGTVRPHDYLGVMADQVSFTCDAGDWLKFNIGWQGQDEDTTQALAVASYPTSLEGFNFQQCAVTVNGVVQNGTTGSLVRSFGIELPFPRASDRYFLRSSPLKAKPILNDYTSGTGSLTFEYTDQVQYNLYKNATKVPIVVDFTSTTNAGVGNPFRITFTIAQAQFTGSTPVVSGPDLLTFEAPFVITDNGTDPPLKVEYMSNTSTVL